MKRLRRILLNTAVALSLLLCLMAAGDWVSSYYRYWDVWYSTVDGLADIYSDLGALYVVRADVPVTGPGLNYNCCTQPSDPRANTLEHDAGTAIQRWKPVRVIQQRASQYFWQAVVIPHWLLLSFLAIAPLLRVRAWRRHRRRAKAGTCPKCGYDLRATPQRCPECGTVPTPPAP